MIYQETLQALMAITGAERALVCTLPMHVEAAHGLDPTTALTAAPLSLSLLEHVATVGQPVLSGDALADPALKEIFSLYLSEIRSVLCVPFWGPSGRIEGVLYADSRVHTAAFNRNHLSRVVRLASRLTARLSGEAGSLEAPPEPPTLQPRPEPTRQARPEQARRQASPQPARGQAPGRSHSLPAGPVPSALRPRSDSLRLFFRSLALMFASGLSLDHSLDLLGRQQDDARMDEVLEGLGREVRSGRSLSGSMSLFPGAFSPFHLHLVRVGEATGSLALVLETIADHQERAHTLNQKLRATLTYPALVLAACLAMVVLGPPFLLQGQFQLLQSSGAEPPFISKVLMTLSNGMRTPWFWVTAALALAGLYRGLKTEAARRYLLGLPLVAPLMHRVALARFSEALSQMTRAGVLLSEALPQAAAVSRDPILAERIASGVEAMRSGSTLRDSLAAMHFFPTAYLAMIEVGENAGKIPALTGWMARLYAQEVEYALERFTALLEPVILLVMGALVGAMLLATLLPILATLQTV